MVKVFILALLLALGGGLVAASGYDRIQKPDLNGQGPLAIQMPPGLQPPPYHKEPSEEWWAARHGQRVTSSAALQECMACHNPQTSCNSCHSYMGVQLIVAPLPRPVAVLPTTTRAATATLEPPAFVPTAADTATAARTAVTSAPTTAGSTAVAAATGTVAPSATATAGRKVSFAKDIQPIVQEHCLNCHGAFGGFDASSYGRMMSTGDNKPVIIPGKPNASLLIQKVTGKQSIGGPMPPFGALTPQQIDLFIQWIAASAPNN